MFSTNLSSGVAIRVSFFFFCALGEVAGVLLVSWDSEGGGNL